MSGVLCDVEVKPKCPLCRSERHPSGIEFFSAHPVECGLIYQVAHEQIMAERRASWESVWADLAERRVERHG